MTEDKAPQDSTADEPVAAGETAAQRVIGAFGGIRPMANKLGVAVSTIQGWKQRNAIPAGRQAKIREAAASHGIALSDEDLAASDRPDEAPDKEKVTTWVAREEPAAADAPPVEASPVTIDMEPSKSAAPDVPPPKSEGRRVPDSGARAADRAAPSAATKPATPAAPAPARQASSGWLIPFLSGAAIAIVGFGVAVLTVDFWNPGGGVDGTVVTGLQRGLEDLRGDLSGQAKALEKLEADLAALPAGSSGTAPEVVRQLNDLDDTVGDLTRRVTRQEQRPAGPGASSPAGPGASSDDLEALSNANRELGARLSTLEGRLVALDPPGPELATLEDRFAGLEGRLADLDRLEQELTALAARPAGPGVESGVDSGTGGEMALVLALIQLRDALDGPGPYAAQLDLFSRAADADAGLEALLAPLRSRAASGVPNLAGLAAAFSQAAGAVVAAGAGRDADGVMSGVLQRLSDVVTVRPVGDIEGTGVGPIVARVEHRLRSGDLPGAVAELDGLDGAAAEASAPWRSDAEARLAADTALAALGAEVVTRLVPSGG